MPSKVTMKFLLACLLAASPSMGLPVASEGTCVSAEAGELSGALAVRAVGAVLENGGYELAVEPGKLATRALRVYSEPSHTLLLVLSDTEFAGTSEGGRWRAALDEKPMATILTELPSGEVRVQLPRRPTTDDEIAIWIYGIGSDGFEADRLISYGKVGFGGFEFSSYINENTSVRL